MSLFLYDTHVHTSEISFCGKVNAKKLVRLYHKAGYHGLVITDHYCREYFEYLGPLKWEEKISLFLKGYHIALDEGMKLGMKILLGIEIRFDENFNDYLVYGLDEDFLYRNQKLYKLNLETFFKLTQNTSLCIYQAHPFRMYITQADPQYLHGIEVYNGNPRHNSNNQLAYEYAKRHGLKMISGSDFHQVEDLARGGIALAKAPSSSEELAQILMEEEELKLLRDG